MDTEEITEKITKIMNDALSTQLGPGMKYEKERIKGSILALIDKHLRDCLIEDLKVTCDETTNPPESVAAGYLCVKITPLTELGQMMLAKADRTKLSKPICVRAGKFHLMDFGTGVLTPLVHFPSKCHKIGTLRIVKRSDKQRSVYIIKF